jgi:hypothetical protein
MGPIGWPELVIVGFWILVIVGTVWLYRSHPQMLTWLLLVTGVVMLVAGLIGGYLSEALESVNEEVEPWVYEVRVPFIVAGAIAALSGVAVMLFRRLRERRGPTTG